MASPFVAEVAYLSQPLRQRNEAPKCSPSTEGIRRRAVIGTKADDIAAADVQSGLTASWLARKCESLLTYATGKRRKTRCASGRPKIV